MKYFVTGDGAVIASHKDDQLISEGAYPDTNVIFKSDDFRPEKDADGQLWIKDHAVDSDDVRRETLRRLMAAFGAADQAHLSIKVGDAQMQAGILTDKLATGAILSKAEKTQAEYLRNAVARYFAIKAAGNKLEQKPVDDFQDDKHWP